MIRELKSQTVADGLRYAEFFGLSSDTPPADGLVTGSKFTEVDTALTLRFDERTGKWFPQISGKTSISGAVVVLGSSPAYDGTEKTQSVTSVTLNGSALTSGTDYTVEHNKATEPGSHELYIVGTGSYAGLIVVPFTIAKGTGSVSVSPSTLTLTEDAGTASVTKTGDGDLSVASSAEAVATAAIEGTTVTVTPVATGEATVTVTLSEGEKYLGDTATIAVTVEEAAAGTEG